MSTAGPDTQTPTDPMSGTQTYSEDRTADAPVMPGETKGLDGQKDTEDMKETTKQSKRSHGEKNIPHSPTNVDNFQALVNHAGRYSVFPWTWGSPQRFVIAPVEDNQ